MLIPSQLLLSPNEKYTAIEKFKAIKGTHSEIEFPTASKLNPKDWLMVDQPKNPIDFSLSPNTFKALIATLHPSSGLHQPSELHRLSELHQPSEVYRLPNVYQSRTAYFIEKNHPDLNLMLYKINFKSIHQLDSFFQLPAIAMVFPKNNYQHTPAPIVRDTLSEKNLSTETNTDETKTGSFSTQKQVILQSSLYIKNENNEKEAFQHKWQLLKMAVRGEIKSIEFFLYIYQCTSSCHWLQSQLESTENH